MNQPSSLLARIRWHLFRHFVDFEIFHRIFPHLQGASRREYPFETDAGIAAETEALDIAGLLETIDRQASQMPRSYGLAFRYVMHRDIHARLTKFRLVGERRIPARLRQSKALA